MEQNTETFKSWDDLTDLEQAACTYWGMYKDAYGSRPRGIDTSSWTMADFEAEFKSLGETISRVEDDRIASENVAVAAWMASLDRVIKAGAGDVETAKKWLMEASDANGDWDYFAWSNGLPYNFFRK